MTSPVLAIEGATVDYGAFRAVDAASFGVAKGTITGLIGPNGAGKSTLFNAICGELPLTSGSIRFQDRHIDGLSPDAIYMSGLARTFQVPRPFAEMSVVDNLMLAAPGQAGEVFWSPILHPRRVREQDRRNLEKAREIIAFMTLGNVANEAAGNLSGGQQKLLELARILMGDPIAILLDEPAAGVNPVLTGVLVEKIEALNRRGVTFLIIEHDMDLVMRHCDPIVAMAAGQIIFEGDAAAAMKDKHLLDAYLGEPAHV